MLFAVIRMDLEIVILKEVSQKFKYPMILLICGIQKKWYKLNHQWDREGGINWKTGVDIHILLYIKQVINKDLLYRTGNSIQHSVMTYMGIEYIKEYIYVYV